MKTFSAKTLDFLFENKLHDSKQWYDEHKEVYNEHVLEPLQHLAQELGPTVLKIDKHFITEPKVSRAISRIRRDTRFSKDKSLYRENMWIVYKRAKSYEGEAPGLYFDISGAGFSYGCGFYYASPQYMDMMRDMILSGSKQFLKAKKAFDSQSIYRIDGEMYKRPKIKDRPAEMATWLDRKGISFNADSKDFQMLFSDKLADKLKNDLMVLKPMYEFLISVSEELLSKTFHQ